MRPAATLCAGIAALSLACGKEEDKFDPEPLLVPWDQISGRIAYVRNQQSEVLVIDAGRRQVYRAWKVEREGLHQVYDVAWHPSGESLVATVCCPGDDWTLISVDLETGHTAELYPELNWKCRAAYSRTGKLAFWSWWSLHVDGVPLSPTVLGNFWSAPSWSPDGSMLALVQDTHDGSWVEYRDINLLDTVAGSVSSLGPRDGRAPVFSPDGGRIAYAHKTSEGDHQLWLASVIGGATVHLSGADSVTPDHPAWSPDGLNIAVESQTNILSPQIYLIDATTGVPTQLTANGGEHPVWIP